MPTPPPKYEFFSRIARIVNSGQSRAVMVAGEIHDLFFVGDKTAKLDESHDSHDKPQDALAGEYVPLMPYLCKQCDVPGVVLLVYELNGPIRCVDPDDRRRLRDAWIQWKDGVVARSLHTQSADRSRCGQAEKTIGAGLRPAHRRGNRAANGSAGAIAPAHVVRSPSAPLRARPPRPSADDFDRGGRHAFAHGRGRWGEPTRLGRPTPRGDLAGLAERSSVY